LRAHFQVKEMHKFLLGILFFKIIFKNNLKFVIRCISFLWKHLKWKYPLNFLLNILKFYKKNVSLTPTPRNIQTCPNPPHATQPNFGNHKTYTYNLIHSTYLSLSTLYTYPKRIPPMSLSQVCDKANKIKDDVH
jgi:hypothetical protein